MLVILRLLKVSPWPVSESETDPRLRRDSPLGWGKWCAISRRASVFLPSPCASLSRCGAPQLPGALGWAGLGWAGTARRVFAAWHRRSHLRTLPSPASPYPDSEAPCVPREFASGLASFLLQPPASGAGTGGSGLRKEPPFESGGRPRPGRLAHPGLGAHGASSAVGLHSPPQRPMLDVGFSFPFRSHDGLAFLLFCLSPRWSALALARDWAFLLPLWRGCASPSDLCSAAAF